MVTSQGTGVAVTTGGATPGVRAAIRRLALGLLRKEQSVATGLLIGLMIWTVTRLVDGIATSGTIEYDTDISPAALKNGTPASLMNVVLTNLSTDTPVTNLQVSIADPYFKTDFSTDRAESYCSYEPPAWVGNDAVCEPHRDGMTFTAPMLVPGTSVRVSTKFTQAGDAAHRPIVRIKPDGISKVQLVEPGVQTFVARHEAGLLIGLLGAALLLFGISVALSEAGSQP
jgi:hypothetical protein